MNYTKENSITIGDIWNLQKWVEKNRSKSNDRIVDTLMSREDGESLQEIANKYGVTKERVRQLEAKGVEVIIHLRKVK